MERHTIMEDIPVIEKLRHELDGMLSMAPAPWSYYNDAIRCGNGNNQLEPDIVDFLNVIFSELPNILDLIDNVCWHRNCELVSGRKKDYLYCKDCKTNLQSDE